MQDKLKPKLIRLMDNYKEQLIVLNRIRLRDLQGQQLGNFQIVPVGQRSFRKLLQSSSSGCDTSPHRTTLPFFFPHFHASPLSLQEHFLKAPTTVLRKKEPLLDL